MERERDALGNSWQIKGAVRPKITFMHDLSKSVETDDKTKLLSSFEEHLGPDVPLTVPLNVCVFCIETGPKLISTVFPSDEGRCETSVLRHAGMWSCDYICYKHRVPCASLQTPLSYSR